MNNILWLVRREYWEHRGGFLWTPVWIAGAILAISVIGIITAEILGARASMHINFGMSMDSLAASLSGHDLAQAGNALDMMQLSFLTSISIGLFFVLFFYLLGALYDDRRDRSVLFWKSLPITDSATVLSKVLAAAIVAPVLALVIGTLAYLVFLLLVVLWGAVHGINTLPAIAAAHPLGMFAWMVAIIPLNALWALPTIGWLLMWSAWARSKPFMWAVLLPVVAAIVVAAIGIGWLRLLGVPLVSDMTWLRTVLERLLVSVWPGTWIAQMTLGSRGPKIAFDEGHVMQALSPGNTWSLLGSANLWVGVIVGAVLIGVAIWLRGRRIETNS